MYTSVKSTGALAPTEDLCTFTPKYQDGVKRGGVMMVHGAGSNAAYCMDTYGKHNERLAAILDAGYTVDSADNGGSQTWGNQFSLDRLSLAYGHLTSQPGVSGQKIALMGDSMGGIVSLNWMRYNADKVSCFIGTIPVVSPNDVSVNNRGGYGSLVNAAYGGTWEADDKQGYDPLFAAQMLLSDLNQYKKIPMLIFYGLNDQVCSPAVTEEFAQRVGSNVTLVPMNLGHEEAAYSTPSRKTIVDFLDANNLIG